MKIYTDHETLVREFGEPVVCVLGHTKRAMKKIIKKRKQQKRYAKLAKRRPKRAWEYERYIRRLNREIREIQGKEHNKQTDVVAYREKVANRPKLSARYEYRKNVDEPINVTIARAQALGYPWRAAYKIADEASNILLQQGYATKEYSSIARWTTNADDGFESVHVNNAVDEAIKKVKAEHPEWWYYGE